MKGQEASPAGEGTPGRWLGGRWRLWGAFEPDSDAASTAAVTTALLWLTGGAVLVAVAAVTGTGGHRLAGIGSGVAAVLVGVLLLGIWRQTGESFPGVLVHVTLLAAGAALAVAALNVAAIGDVLAVLVLAPVLAAACGALLPRRWSLAYLGVLAAGAGGICANRHLHLDLAVPAMVGATLVVGVAVALSRARIHQLTLTDPVTGLPNLEALDLVVARQGSLSRRTGMPMALVVVATGNLDDVDGLPPGPEPALRAVAAAWAADLRGADVLAHLGDGEFVLVLPNCGPSEVAAIIRRMLSQCGGRATAGATGYLEGDDLGTMLDRARRARGDAGDLAGGAVRVRSEDGTLTATLDDVAGQAAAVSRRPVPPPV